MASKKEPLPPWLMYPDIPAGDIEWRMGVGEDYMNDLWSWAEGVSPDERRRWLEKYLPIPAAWMLWAVEVFAYPDDSDAALDSAWERLQPPKNKTK